MNFKPAIHNIFNQLSDLLESLPNEEYCKKIDLLNGASIGQHVRHTLEFFVCLLEGCPNGVINYDSRKRDLFLESNTLEASTCIKKLEKELNALTGNSNIMIEQSYDQEQNIFAVESNLHRELIYNIEHAIHHMALIRVAMKIIRPEGKLPDDFGVASSTLRYRSESKLSMPSA